MLKEAYYETVRRFFAVTAWLQYRHHDAPVRPVDVVAVDPAEIPKRKTETPSTDTRLPLASGVAGGDWDLAAEPVETDPVFRGFEARFEDGKPWAETPYVPFLRGATSEHGERSTAEIRQRCRRMDRLYHDVAANGYRSQRELEAESGFVEGLGPVTSLPPEFREVGVNVARDGEFVWHGGMHRLCVAKLLDVDQIPVRIVFRHREWQSIRDSVARGERDAASFDGHPDLSETL